MRTTERLKQVAAGVFETAPKILLLPDGRLMAFVYEKENPDRMLRVRYSADDGETWSGLEPLFSLRQSPPEVTSVTEAVLDRNGEISAFMLRQWKADPRGEGERGGPGTYDGYRLDIWQARSTNGRTAWQEPRCIWEGYTGALNSCIRLRSGRILLPFSYYVPRTWANRGSGLDVFTFMGMFDCTVLYSDDDGATWALSNSTRVVTPDISYAYGACEPVTLELADGRVWMLLRTQMGRFYETFSADGAVWSRPEPLRIVSSDSPAGLVRLHDGRIVLVWNNCLRHPYAYGGRQVIHAAISEDEGKTWRGYREVGRDPRRAEPPPLDGDFGTAYPFPAVTQRDQVIISTGQGQGRTLIARLDPAYLYETAQKSNFKDGVEDWSIFGTHGVELVPHPVKKDAKVLRLQRVDEEFPSAAVWNFPMGAKGSVRVRCRMEAPTQGLIVGLTDHFSTPYDFEDVFNNVFTFTLTPDVLPAAAAPQATWHEVRLDWDCARQKCRLKVDGRPVGSCQSQRLSDGICYLRLRAVAKDKEPGFTMIESAKADVAKAWPAATAQAKT